MRLQSFQNYKVINTVIVLSDSESYIMCIQDLLISIDGYFITEIKQLTNGEITLSSKRPQLINYS